MTTRAAFLWFITFTAIGKATAVPKYGPYDVILHRIETCEDEGTGQVHFDNKIRYAGGGNHVYNATFTFQLPIDEHFKWEIEIQIWGNQGWRPRAWTYKADGCKGMMEVLGSFYKSLYKASGVDVEECPFPAGTFTPKNWKVEMKFDSFPTMFYKKARCIATFSYKGVKTGCLIVYLESVPKKTNATTH